MPDIHQITTLQYSRVHIISDSSCSTPHLTSPVWSDAKFGYSIQMQKTFRQYRKIFLFTRMKTFKNYKPEIADSASYTTISRTYID